MKIEFDKEILKTTPLFRGMELEGMEKILECLGAKCKSYKKGALICSAGDEIDSMGVVIEGGVTIENDDIWGNKTILEHVGRGQVFGESYACLPGEPMLVSVAASEDAVILFLNVGKVLNVCGSGCRYHSILVRNLLNVAAAKNVTMSRRIFYTSAKTIRGRLLSYLSDQALRQGSNRIRIPFDRQQLADYLGVDRSALSHELGKMQKEGLLEVKKNQFFLMEL